MTAAETATAPSWWSSTGWFSQAGGLQEAGAEPQLVHEPLPTAAAPPEADGANAAAASEGLQGVGGAVAQSRFLSARCHIPLYKDAPRSARTVEPTQPPAGGTGLGGLFRERWPGVGRTCDGGAAPRPAGSCTEPSTWVFDVDAWEWRREGSGAQAQPRSAQHDIAARRWGDGRDTLAPALQPSQQTAAAGGEQGAAKRQRVVTAARRAPEGGWAAVGGLSRQKEQLAAAVLLPLRHPALFKRLGVDAVRGVLLHGPPGSGKTLLARALAQEAGPGVHFEALSGAECAGGADGAARMRTTFHTARSKAPAILFLDELDAVAPTRSGGSALAEAERQAVAQLLSLIDELRSSKAQVALVAATNRRSAVDAALRRAGRLDLEVALGPLTQQDRLEVLRCATRSMPLGPGVCLEQLAHRLRGYTGADVAAVCTEAALRCASEAVAAAESAAGGADGMAEEDLSQHLASPKFLASLRVEGRHFEAAVGQLGPAVLRGLSPEVPEVQWEDVGGLQEAKAALRELVDFPLSHGSLMQRMGLPPPRGALLYGPPGCGKTLLAKAAATSCSANFLSVRGPELLQMWLGESERAVRTLFETARCAAPCLVFFDEIDSIAGRRAGAGGDAGGAAARVLNQLLLEMDGLSDRGAVFVLAATNRPEALDPAVLRPGRFDHLVKVALPDEPSRQEILRSRLSRAPLHPDVDLPGLAAATEGMSGADLAELCRRAGMAAVREWVAAEQAQQAQHPHSGGSAAAPMEVQTAQGEEGPAPSLLTQAHLHRALRTLRRSVGAAVAERYDAMEAQLREGGLERFAGVEQEQEEGPEGGSAEAAAGEGGESSNGSDAQPPQQVQQPQPQPQRELMQRLVRATLDHTYAAKVEGLQHRVAQLESMLRAAGLAVPPPAAAAPAAGQAGGSSASS